MQDDSSSCGVYILKYAYIASGEMHLINLSVNESRRYFADRIVKEGKVSVIFCSYCNNETPRQTTNNKNIKWVRCDKCVRWVHVVCLTDPTDVFNISVNDFKCALCNTIESAFIRKENIVASKLNTTSQSNYPKEDILEIIRLENTRARNCCGCKEQLILRGKLKIKSKTTIGLRKPYEQSVFNTSMKMDMLVTRLMYIHATKHCLNLALPGFDCAKSSSFIINENVLGDLLYAPTECSRFEREFCIILKDVPRS
jgi:hypothetical protein